MRRALGALALAASLSACGSTVQLTGHAALDNGTDLNNGFSSSAPKAGSTSGSPVAGTSGTVGISGSTGGTTGTSRGPSSGSTTGSSTGATSTPTQNATTSGTTGALVSSKTPIKVGVLYAKGVDKVASAFGISGLTTGDTKAQGAAVIAYINAHGGMGGHPVAPFYYGIDTSSTDTEALYQAACTAFTQDYKVRYVITILNLRPSSLPCFAKGGVGVLDDQVGVGDDTISKYAGYYAGPGDFAPGRMLKVLVDDLWKRGWLTATSKVGSFAYDTPDSHTLVDGGLAKALAAHGLKVTSKQFVSNDAGSVSQASNVSLQYRAAGVDRVIPVGASPLFLMNAASGQGYHPAYAMYTSFGPGALIEGTAPKDQLKNAAGIGWQPLLDIGAGTKPGPVSLNETLCFDIMRKASQATTSATTRGFQLQVCNTLFYLKAAADAVPSVPQDLLTVSRANIGASFKPADTFRTDVSKRPDGAAGFRSLAFNGSCSCFQYVSPVQPTP